jgi:nicotinate phosphoribosyltransferase
MGTVAHSWVMSFCGEPEAFRQAQRLLGESAVQLIDTYDTIKGAQRAAETPGPFWGVRIDSGDFLPVTRQVRAILDDAGHTDAKIMISGDLDEYRIRDLLAAGAPIDTFGVGTQLSVSADAPTLSTVYKLVEIEICGIQRFTAKFSDDKPSYPGSKQIFRDTHRDVIARSGECGRGEALLRPIILGGRLLEPLPTLEQARQRAAASIASLPASLRQLDEAEPWPVIHSRELRELIERTRHNILG